MLREPSSSASEVPRVHSVDLVRSPEFIKHAGEDLEAHVAEWLADTKVGEGISPELSQAIKTAANELGKAIADHGDGITSYEVATGIAERLVPGLALERRQRDREADMALVDEKTGLPNDRAFNRALPAAEEDLNTAVIFIDVNDFGKVNKKLSDRAGDRMLRYIADYLKQITKQVVGTDTRVFRKGGDEFAILAPADKAEELRRLVMSEFGSLETPDIPEALKLLGGRYHDKTHGVVGYVRADKTEVSLSAGVGQDKDTADSNTRAIKRHVKASNRVRRLARNAFGVSRHKTRKPSSF